MDERLKCLLMDEIQEAKRAQTSADQALELVYNTIFTLFDDVNLAEIPTEAENADNLEQAISCYVQYGEYDIEKLVDEICNIKGN